MFESETSVTVAEASLHRTPKKWHGEVVFVHDARWFRGSFRPALNWRRACVWGSIWQLELTKRERSVIRGRQTRMCLLIARCCVGRSLKMLITWILGAVLNICASEDLSGLFLSTSELASRSCGCAPRLLISSAHRATNEHVRGTGAGASKGYRWSSTEWNGEERAVDASEGRLMERLAC
jgi:hypothetical protein